ncbi:SDR family oxidoreductase [Streptomyces sp. SID8375]|nr:SDR family oxidoreductase [Streptomyces sp. SID8375]
MPLSGAPLRAASAGTSRSCISRSAASHRIQMAGTLPMPRTSRRACSVPTSRRAETEEENDACTALLSGTTTGRPGQLLDEHAHAGRQERRQRALLRRALTVEGAQRDTGRRRHPLNAVTPGTTVTPITEPMLADAEIRKAVDASVPMPLHGHARPEQIAPLLAWLTSPENTHVTGQVVFVDGGADAVVRRQEDGRCLVAGN